MYHKCLDLLAYVLINFDFFSAASAADLQLTPTSTAPAPESSTREESSSAGPVAAAPAPEATAPEGSTPTEATPGVDVALPDLPPPEPQQVEAGAGGEKQVEAPCAAPADGAGECLIAPAGY
jgi:hypothetical protein